MYKIVYVRYFLKYFTVHNVRDNVVLYMVVEFYKYLLKTQLLAHQQKLNFIKNTNENINAYIQI